MIWNSPLCQNKILFTISDLLFDNNEMKISYYHLLKEYCSERFATYVCSCALGKIKFVLPDFFNYLRFLSSFKMPCLLWNISDNLKASFSAYRFLVSKIRFSFRLELKPGSSVGSYLSYWHKCVTLCFGFLFFCPTSQPYFKCWKGSDLMDYLILILSVWSCLSIRITWVRKGIRISAANVLESSCETRK